MMWDINSNFLKISQSAKGRTVFFIFFFGALLFYAWINRFVQDDAFISFQYARNLVEGNGLVWNPFEKTEGYTNFLWVLLIAFGYFCGVDPVSVSYTFGFSFFVLSLFFNYRILSNWFQERSLALWGTAFLGSNYTFSCYATGGLETSLQMALEMTLFWIYFRLRTSCTFRDLGLCSILMGLSLWNRLDTALLLIVLLLGLRKPLMEGSWTDRIQRSACLFLPMLVLVGSWLTWKFFYYGNFLPNTFYIKFHSASLKGLYYLYLFFLSYGLFPFLMMIFFLWPLWKKDFRMSSSASFLILWGSYLIYIGGDFMEFRMILPILPPLFWMILWIVRQQAFSRPLFSAVIAWILLGSLHHSFAFDKLLRREGIDSISQLGSYVKDNELNWTQIGKVLLYYFPERDIRIALSSAGAIPYYSQLPSIDILGLNDSWIAHHGENWGKRTGHELHATLDYLKQRNVQLVLGNPWIKSSDREVRYSFKALLQFIDIHIGSIKELPPTARILEIPVAAGYVCVVLYLCPHPTLDRAIQQYSWKQYRIVE